MRRRREGPTAQVAEATLPASTELSQLAESMSEILAGFRVDGAGQTPTARVATVEV